MSILPNAWRVNQTECDAIANVERYGVVVTIPGHPHVRLVLTTAQLKNLIKAATKHPKRRPYRDEILLQNGGITTKYRTAEKLEEEGLITILEKALYGQVIKFGIDPHLKQAAVRYELTEAGKLARVDLLKETIS